MDMKDFKLPLADPQLWEDWARGPAAVSEKFVRAKRVHLGTSEATPFWMVIWNSTDVKGRNSLGGFSEDGDTQISERKAKKCSRGSNGQYLRGSGSFKYSRRTWWLVSALRDWCESVASKKQNNARILLNIWFQVSLKIIQQNIS